MIGSGQRQSIMTRVTEAIQAGARQKKACLLVGLSERTLQRWQKNIGQIDRRTLRTATPAHKLSPCERAELLAVTGSAEFGHLPPSQIVPMLADQGCYIASESTFYRVLRDAGQLSHRRQERPARRRRKPRALSADAPNQLYSWDITYLPGCIKGAYFYLCRWWTTAVCCPCTCNTHARRNHKENMTDFYHF